jgi:hypothetical protein
LIFSRRRGNWIAKLTTLLLLFSLLSPMSNGFAAGDVTPPKLTSFSLSGTKVTQGESIMLSAEILEEESGVDYAYAYYNGPTGSNTKGGSKSVDLIYNPATQNYEGSFTVSTYDDAGVWKLSYIYLKDKQGNGYRVYHGETPSKGWNYEYRNLSGYNIEVYGTVVDITAPKLNSLSISAAIVTGGESITVSADIIEEGSGVEYVYVSFVPPNGDSEGGKGIELFFNQETGKYEGIFYANPYDLPGIWSIGTIHLGDKLYNSYTYRNGEIPSQEDYYEVRDLSAYNIDVYGTKGDVTPPQFNGFSVSKTTILPGEQVQISADIVDDLSGVEHVTVSYKTPVGYPTRDVELTYNPEASKYEGILVTNPSDPEGIWQLYAINVADNKGNFYTYYNSKEGSKGGTFEHRDLSQYNILVETPDTSVPVTSMIVQGQTGANGWYGSNVMVLLTAEDNDAGVDKTLYRINGGDWIEYASQFSLSVDGTTNVEYKSIDKAGNEENVKAGTIKIDTQKPVTSIGDIPSYPIRVDLPLSFTAQDETSGIAWIEYRVNGGSWTQYQAPTYVRTEGTNTVEYRSVDMAGNVEDVKRVEFVIDKTAPSTTSSEKDGWYNSDAEVSLTAADSISVVEKTEYRLNGGTWTAYTSPVKVSGQGINTLEYRSFDKAGNVEDIKTVQVKIDKTQPLLNVTFNPSVIIGGTGKLINVKATVDARDEVSGIASFELVSITSSQPDVVKGGKLPAPDIQGAEYGTADTDFYLRDERSGSDRIYTITYKLFDNAGNSTITTSTIMVKRK